MVRCIKILLYPLAWLLGLTDAPRPPQHKRSRMFLLLVSEAWVSINTNRIRAFLAMLGIIIGVGSVILMVAIGEGSQRKIEKSIKSLGTNLIIISANPPPVTELRRNYTPLRLKPRDFDAIGQLPNVDEVSYSSSVFTIDATVGTVSEQLPVYGIDPAMLYIRNWVFHEGDNFTTEDLHKQNRVAIIGSEVASKFFPNESPIGKTIALGIKQIGFQVIGVMQPKGSAPDGQKQDNFVFVPISTYKSYINPDAIRPIQFVYVKVATPEFVETVAADIKTTLRELHRIPDNMGDNFTIHNLDAIMKVATDTTDVFSALLGAIASISLIVGGVGIMNIMLVTVSERTREIGIRKAIGATEKQILMQFLLEAIMISCVGSVAGLIIGLGGGIAADAWFAIPVAFGIDTVIMALLIAVGIGIISGLYPAHKAAKMEPIEALRSIGS